MRITDRRHGYVPTPEEEATDVMIELAERALHAGYLFPRKGREDKPGKLIQSLSEGKRAKLKHLSSEHFAAADLPGLALCG